MRGEIKMTEERKSELYALWGNETNDPETEEWREDLTPEEATMVDEWDGAVEAGYIRAVAKICQ